jgi:hypothetical protein
LVCGELRAGVFFWREWIGLFGGDFSLIEAEAEVELRGEVEWGESFHMFLRLVTLLKGNNETVLSFHIGLVQSFVAIEGVPSLEIIDIVTSANFESI